MTWNLLPTALWAIAMLLGLAVSLRVLRRMIVRRRVQRRYRPTDRVLAEVADRNVATEWLRASGFAAMSLAGVIALGGFAATGTTGTMRWLVVAWLIVGGALFVAGAVRDDRHATRVMRLAMDGQAEEAE